MARQRLGELLVEKRLITELQLGEALAEQQRWGGQLGGYFVTMGFLDESTLIQVLAEQLRLPYVHLDPEQISPTIVRAIPPLQDGYFLAEYTHRPGMGCCTG